MGLDKIKIFTLLLRLEGRRTDAVLPEVDG
jgi:hypothetical protein